VVTEAELVVVGELMEGSGGREEDWNEGRAVRTAHLTTSTDSFSTRLLQMDRAKDSKLVFETSETVTVVRTPSLPSPYDPSTY
jgi:hypothetical protein